MLDHNTQAWYYTIQDGMPIISNNHVVKNADTAIELVTNYIQLIL